MDSACGVLLWSRWRLRVDKVGGGAQSRARDVCEVRIRLWNRTGRISHAEALMSMSEAVVNSSPLLFRCVFVGDSSIFVTNIFSLILGISVAVLAFPDGENQKSAADQTWLQPAGYLPEILRLVALFTAWSELPQKLLGKAPRPSSRSEI